MGYLRELESYSDVRGARAVHPACRGVLEAEYVGVMDACDYVAKTLLLLRIQSWEGYGFFLVEDGTFV